MFLHPRSIRFGALAIFALVLAGESLGSPADNTLHYREKIICRDALAAFSVPDSLENYAGPEALFQQAIQTREKVFRNLMNRFTDDPLPFPWVKELPGFLTHWKFLQQFRYEVGIIPLQVLRKADTPEVRGTMPSTVATETKKPLILINVFHWEQDPNLTLANAVFKRSIEIRMILDEGAKQIKKKLLPSTAEYLEDLGIGSEMRDDIYLVDNTNELIEQIAVFILSHLCELENYRDLRKAHPMVAMHPQEDVLDDLQAQRITLAQHLLTQLEDEFGIEEWLGRELLEVLPEIIESWELPITIPVPD